MSYKELDKGQNASVDVATPAKLEVSIAGDAL